MRGLIYKIVSPSCDKCYVGSTQASLPIRWSRHKSSFKSYNENGRGNYSSSYNLIEKGDARIELVEECWLANKAELKRKEGEYQRKMKDEIVNIRVAGRDTKEWREDNPEIVKACRKRYYDNNQDKILEKLREKYVSKKQEPKKMYKQLERYYDNKNTVLRRVAIKNITKFNRRPTKLTIEKYEISEEEIQEALNLQAE
tara:strand:+ start:256 stop:852 length:597 start_codon:yes stop_codon:yes gene_type:complete